MIRGLIFDLDGVLVDTARFHFLAWKRLAAEYNFVLTPELNEQFKGVNRAACMRLMCEWVGIAPDADTFARQMTRKNDWYLEYVDHMTEADVLPGARAFIDRARASGCKLAIGSASKNCARVLERTRLRDLFDAVSDGLCVEKAKPDPAVFVYAADRLGLKYNECCVFEDAQAGIDAAKRGGMRAVGIGGEHLNGYDLLYPSLGQADLRAILRD